MGWKNVKEHYRISHYVQVTSEGICIGSADVHNLIVIADFQPKWGPQLGQSDNVDFARYFEEMSGDLDLLKSLIEMPDTFSRYLPVFTYDGADIQKKKCEEYGWPNVTHCGLMMHDNAFFQDRKDAVDAAIKNAKSWIEFCTSRLDRSEKDFHDLKSTLAECHEALKTLKAD